MNITQRGVLPPVQLVELDTDIYTTGSFTPGWAGFSVNPAGDLDFVRLANTAWLYIASGTNRIGTSNAGTFEITGLPALVTPPREVDVPCVAAVAGVPLLATVRVLTTNVLQLYIARTTAVADQVTFSQAAWPVAGSKGLFSQWQISYPLV